MRLKKILVIGSVNTDMVVKSERLPTPGETILGGQFFMFQGGKGANQAVAAARLGGDVSFISKVGDDIFGKEASTNLKNEGINISSLLIDQIQPSGVALITVDSRGENSIVVASGANAALTPDDIKHIRSKIEEADIILLQLEIPIPTIEYIVGLVSELNKTVILNPAPAIHLSDELLSKIDIITPNENEAELLTCIKVNGLESARKAASVFQLKGIKTVIITLGSAGAFIQDQEFSEIIPTIKVAVTDTTAAGDTFSGALAVAISEGKAIKEAIGFANKAASISVTRMGAQASIPYRKEIDL